MSEILKDAMFHVCKESSVTSKHNVTQLTFPLGKQLGTVTMKDCFHATDVAEFQSYSSIWVVLADYPGTRRSYKCLMSCDATRILLEQGHCSQNSATNLLCLLGLAPRLVHFRSGRCPAFRVPYMFSSLHFGTSRGVVRFCG
jgi:hypothetical protein